MMGKVDKRVEKFNQLVTEYKSCTDSKKKEKIKKSIEKMKKKYNEVVVFPAEYNFLRDLQKAFGKVPIIGNRDHLYNSFEAKDGYIIHIDFSNVISNALEKQKPSIKALKRYMQVLYRSLPHSIQFLPYLDSISINKMLIQAIPQRFLELPQLGELVFSGTDIKEVPRSLGKLKKLEYLSITNNSNLAKLPENIGDLRNLKVLNINGGKLRSLPTSITSLDSLVYLGITNNNLDDLPSGFGNLSSLQWLDLRGNRLAKARENIQDLRKLRKLKGFSLSYQQRGQTQMERELELRDWTTQKDIEEVSNRSLEALRLSLKSKRLKIIA
ncbi:MAG: leucine-rich repeat domain-containing protein [Candidatus Hodarchaeota archaeon]